MRKRTIISIIITIIIMFCTNKLWLDIKPIPVSFNIEGNGNSHITIQLNKKNNDDFKKIKDATGKFNLDEIKVAKFNVERAKYPKRFRIIIDKYNNSNPIIIKDIQFRNGKYKFCEMDKYIVKGAKSEVKNGALIIYPENKRIYITYSDKIKVKASMKFNFEIFVTLLVLSFLLIYKTSDYVADFSTIKHKSRIDIVFLLIFFVFLFVPMSNINQDNISKQENRTLAVWQPFIKKNGEINFNFGKDYEKWFNDRFNLREFFVNTNDFKLFLSKNWITKDVMQGNNDWLFLGWQESKDSYTNSKMFSNEELTRIDNYLNNINEYCKKHNKKFYFLIAPDKSRIYPEHYPEKIKQLSNISRSIQLINYIKKHSNVKVIYPKDRLLSEKGENLLYWKQDTHWNLLGAYYGYLELIKVIKKDFPNLSSYEITEYTTQKYLGDLYNMSPPIIRETDNTIYTIPQINTNELCLKTKKSRDDVYCYNPVSNINLLMYRDSFSTALIPYLTHSFGSSKYMWTYCVKTDAMKDADVIILQIVERYLHRLISKQLEIK